MALRKFRCVGCDHEWSRLIKGQNAECPNCGMSSEAALPIEVSTATYEMRDKYHGKQLRKGQAERMRKRMNDHHDRNEVTEKIDKFGMDEAVRHGWLKRAKKV